MKQKSWHGWIDLVAFENGREWWLDVYVGDFRRKKGRGCFMTTE